MDLSRFLFLTEKQATIAANDATSTAAIVATFSAAQASTYATEITNDAAAEVASINREAALSAAWTTAIYSDQVDTNSLVTSRLTNSSTNTVLPWADSYDEFTIAQLNAWNARQDAFFTWQTNIGNAQTVLATAQANAYLDATSRLGDSPGALVQRN